MKIYIYWEHQEYFTSFEDAYDYYVQHFEHTTFNEFLYEHYESEDIFNFTEAARQFALRGYRSGLANEVRDWIENYCDVVEIEVECKEV